MRKLFVVPVLFVLALTASVSPAAAHSDFRCEATLTGVTIDDDLVVPRDASCTLIDSTVTGNVQVNKNAFFQATNTDIAGKVRANRALTVFIDTGSTIARSLKVYDTAQAFVFNATVTGDVLVDRATEVAQVCGTTVEEGDLEVERSGIDILVGDPQAVDCAGNTVSRGDLEVERNRAEVEFVVRGNTVTEGDLEVLRNTGPVEKFVEDNTGGDDLNCFRNEEPFTASGNTGWDDRNGQCEVVLECTATETGADVDEVVVPADAACVLIDSTVREDVHVRANGFFQATNTDIGGTVRALAALTLFLDTGTTVGGSVKAHETVQVFVFNTTVGHDVEVSEATEVVQVCGTTVERGDLEVERSGIDILVGDPLAEDCAGNTVSRGDLELERNHAEIEFVVRGNAVVEGDLEVVRNTGPVEKFVDANTGGDDLECFGNEEPFRATGNTGFSQVEGQCIEV